MIVLQIFSLVMIATTSGSTGHSVRFMNLVTAAIFIIPAIAYIVLNFLGDMPSYVPLILGVMMLTEAAYALH